MAAGAGTLEETGLFCFTRKFSISKYFHSLLEIKIYHVCDVQVSEFSQALNFLAPVPPVFFYNKAGLVR